MTPEEREALLAGYALGSLSDPDARDAERLIRNDESAQREYEAYLDLTDMIALSVPLRRADPSLRTRVLEAARRNPSPWRARQNWRRFMPAAGLAAALALVTVWAVTLQNTIGDLREEQSALAAVVEASAKRLDTLDQTTVNAQQAETLGLRLETAIRDQQTLLAVQAADDVHIVTLATTSAAHGGHGQYVYSPEQSAGVLLVYDLPPLPVGASYKVWLEDEHSELVLANTFLPTASGDSTVVLSFEGDRIPVRLFVVASSAGGSDGPVVLRGSMSN
ncbi:MAG: anti-sigma factor [Dehalococcoidia bacterium]|nr:anti-sigma factor [Dehalococcoidia bacterium]MCA9849832.1 anti-sigma factor [Dehalococcoidia bacterium]MCB9482854.1 anti-sigma factor [Dehalococcoidia bacterium]MCB9492099.1 anti-sigma factor [Dehalococcoidia bacterium]